VPEEAIIGGKTSFLEMAHRETHSEEFRECPGTITRFSVLLDRISHVIRQVGMGPSTARRSLDLCQQSIYSLDNPAEVDGARPPPAVAKLLHGMGPPGLSGSIAPATLKASSARWPSISSSIMRSRTCGAFFASRLRFPPANFAINCFASARLIRCRDAVARAEVASTCSRNPGSAAAQS